MAFKKRWVKQAVQEEQESQKAMELERKPSQRRGRLSVSQSMSMSSIKELLANPAKVEKQQQDQESSSGSINLRSDRGHKAVRTVSVILQIPLLAEMEGADADAVRYVSPAAFFRKRQRSVLFSPACLGSYSSLPARH